MIAPCHLRLAALPWQQTFGRVSLIGPALVIALAAVLAASPAVAEVTLSTPSGLSSGAKFRFLFLTSGSRDAASVNIADYNTFVTTEAGGATYDGTTVSWRAVGSTAAVIARDNVGGFGTNVPVYLVNGTKLSNNMTDSTGGLWGLFQTTIPPNITISATQSGAQYAWTGSLYEGSDYPGNVLGANQPMLGIPSNPGFWIFAETTSAKATLFPMYAISNELTVAAVPEPSSMALAAFGIAGAGLAYRRRQFACRRSRA